jgi:hypothetical protein
MSGTREIGHDPDKRFHRTAPARHGLQQPLKSANSLLAYLA